MKTQKCDICKENTGSIVFFNCGYAYHVGCIFASYRELLSALQILTKHAQEVYPHFESPRGQADINLAIEAIKNAGGV
jgi:hypothetical protein